MTDIDAWFSQSYQQARDRFRSMTCALPHGAIDIGDELTIDWAWSGDIQSPNVLVFSSGLHGVEGFPGSAAQLYLLSQTLEVPTLWLHILNPWGMKNLRRVDVANVDLNRNFLDEAEDYSGAHSMYSHSLDRVLNPTTLSSFFLPHILWAIFQHGYGHLKNAVTVGQYDYPKGLFYGGGERRPNSTQLMQFLNEHMTRRERIVHIDLHSGLGKFGDYSLLLEEESDSSQVARARHAFGSKLKSRYGRSSGYTVRGGFTHALAQQFQHIRYDGLTCEFGTYGTLRVLTALRNENCCHHYGSNYSEHSDNRQKRRLLEVFSPSDRDWRERVLAHAVTVYRQASTLLHL